MNALRKDGTALEFATVSLKRDRECVLAAVAQNGSALRVATAALKHG